MGLREMWNQTLMFTAYILFYLDETRFCLPLEEGMIYSSGVKYD